jgi:hypothetical protein
MVQFSTIIRPDMLQILFMLLVIMSSMAALSHPKQFRRHLMLAGFSLGFATASKYPGVLAVVPIGLSALLVRGISIRERALALLAAAVASILAVFVSSPYLLLDIGSVLGDLTKEARSFHLSATSPGFGGALRAYLFQALPSAVGIPAAGIGAAGLLLLLLKLNRYITIPALFAVYLLAISSLSLYWERWALPLIPLLAVGFAYLASTAFTRLIRRVTIGSAIIVAVLAAVTIVPPLLASAKDAERRLNNRNSRVVAYDWVLTNLPAGSRVLLETYSPQLSVDQFDVYFADEGELASWRVRKRANRPDGFFGNIGKGLGSTCDEGAAELLRRAEIDYVIVSTWYDRYLAERSGPHYNAGMDQIVRCYEAIFSATIEIKRFGRGVRVLEVKRDTSG